MYFNPIRLLPLLALTFATPTPLTARQNSGVDTTWLAIVPGGSCGSNSGGVAGNFTITTPYCTQAGVSEYLIGELPEVDCKATVYNGFGCVAGTETNVIDIPAGSGDVCVFSGTFQGVCPHCPQVSVGYTCAL